ncbi:magnesium chelatase domain-containing protein, partial [Bordetella pertussis]|uniref:magnesium chelatase domain-containing protein n=1 Tax=Bordetella pertussis TaxID=520 RepID=UPI000A4BDA09
MTLAVLASRAIAGWQAPAVRVETHLGSGLPAFAIVGLPDVEVRESRERVRAAIQNSGFVWAAELSLSGALVPLAAPLALALAVAREQPGATLVLPAGSA